MVLRVKLIVSGVKTSVLRVKKSDLRVKHWINDQMVLRVKHLTLRINRAKGAMWYCAY